ncbi:zinc ribbon domain-containing protein [Adlercreutzia sp. R21]|uniref:zinc ribbon domain-containing protein n=1 Tax=Adlercreutzia wanghongyangiae TaxID=3111451 RepID=UPI002DB708F0|nr:zinc ribbon domain-containing protein [Adlercreutzia sp. R21]MEC4184972.1 zinc ribbon domain-containing protein [Adlercreutzia sp. R21]
MFCPKCGNQLPDGSAFCGKCGAQLGAAAPAPAASARGSAAAAPAAFRAPSAAGPFPPLRIAAIAMATAALLFALMPWFSTSSAAVTASGYASGGADLVAGLTGADVSLPEFKESYSVFQFGELAATATTYLDAEAQIADAMEAAEAAASGRARAISLSEPQGSRKPAEALFMAMVCWAAWCLVVVAGAVCALVTRGRNGLVLGIGAGLLAAVSLAWAFGSYGVLESAGLAVSGGATNAIVCGAASIAVIVCVLVSRQAKA